MAVGVNQSVEHFYQGQLLEIKHNGFIYLFSCITPCSVFNLLTPKQYLDSGYFDLEKVSKIGLVEACMRGNPKPEGSQAHKWIHPYVEFDKEITTQTFLAYCPHCKREWTIPKHVLEDMEGAKYIDGVLDVNATLQMFIDGSGM